MNEGKKRQFPVCALSIRNMCTAGGDETMILMDIPVQQRVTPPNVLSAD